MTCLLCGTRGVVYLVYNQESDKDGMEPVGSSFVTDDWCVLCTSGPYYWVGVRV